MDRLPQRAPHWSSSEGRRTLGDGDCDEPHRCFEVDVLCSGEGHLAQHECTENESFPASSVCRTKCKDDTHEPDSKIAARICGSSRSKCDYCGGNRLHALRVADAYNKNVFDETTGSSCASRVDESNTSKSYGLLFDSLPYGTYEDLINRGWRRSGKHLYLPHNFESCCPAITIRLDVLKFAAAAGCERNDYLARSILTGGSKSQRKVGKRILRLLESYNSKCSDGQLLRLRSEDSVHGPHFAEMQLDEHGSLTAETDRDSEPLHQHKKSKLNDQSPTANGEYLQSLLDKLSAVVYETLTNEAKKAVSGMQQMPSWSWWNGNGSSLPKWCRFKLKQSRDGSMMTASTSACAAACGRSRGSLDKSSTLLSVKDALQGFIDNSTLQNTKDAQVKGINIHNKSGHVNVTFTGGHTPTNHSNQNKKKSCIQKRDNVDPIFEFITRHNAISNKLNKKSEKGIEEHQQRFLTVKSVPAHESSLQPEVHQLFARYQTAVHGDPDPFSGGSETSKEIPDVNRERDYVGRRDSLGFLDIDAAYSHLEEGLRSNIKSSYLTFYRFLCETPMMPDVVTTDDKQICEDGYDIHIPYGSYHQQYRMSSSKDAFDGPLIAVGVVDILANCFSSVYAFYDPILSDSMNLGTYTALREIEWVRRASQFRELHYYYLGYYIHSCPKMSYKACYKPSQLLCPVSMKWVDFDVAKKRIDERSPVRHCCALVDDAERKSWSCNIDENEDITLDIGDSEPQLVELRTLNSEVRAFVDPFIEEFVSAVGNDLCPQFTIKLR